MSRLLIKNGHLIEPSSGNCFEKNKPSTFTFFSPEGELPTDGCDDGDSDSDD